MTIDLTPAPVLQELIEDLEIKLHAKQMCLEAGIAHDGVEGEIELLEEVLERVIAQQELINLKTNSINLN